MKNLVATYFFDQKNIRNYFITYLLAAVITGCLSFIPASSASMFWLMKIIQLAAFTGLGLLHATAVERGLQFVEDRFQNKLSFTAFITSLICAWLLIFYFFSKNNILVMALASSCAFFLPFTVMQLWNMYKETPPTGSMTWYGFDESLDSSDTVYLSSIPITFALTTNEFEKEPIPFSIKAPLHMELSKVFNLFLVAAKKNYEIHIESSDENNRPFGWQFFTPSMGGLLNIQIDPDMSVGDNRKIKANTVIFVKRTKAAGAYHIPPQTKMDLTTN